MQLDRDDEGFSIDASLLGKLLNVPPFGLQALMRNGEITGRCERGEGEHAGQYRLTFFYKGRRARLNIGESGQVIRQSSIDFGDRPLPSSTHKLGSP